MHYTTLEGYIEMTKSKNAGRLAPPNPEPDVVTIPSAQFQSILESIDAAIEANKDGCTADVALHLGRIEGICVGLDLSEFVDDEDGDECEDCEADD